MHSYGSKPLTVGFITLESNSSYTTQLWLGANDCAANLGINLITFGISEQATNYGTDADEFYAYLDHLIDLHDLDGLLVWTAGLLKDHGAASQFLTRYSGIPLVSLGIDVPGSHRLLMDGYRGMYELVSHLITACQRCDLAFITGQASNEDAQLRLSAYKDALRHHGLPIREEFIVPGAFSWDSQVIGRRAVSELLDKRGLHPDAIIASSDDLAIGVLQELHLRGVLLPDAMSVTGFDNIPDCSAVFPPLTTVDQPSYELAWQGLQMLFDLLCDKSTPERKVIPTELVVRQSCGGAVQAMPIPLAELPQLITFAKNDSSVKPIWVHSEERICKLLESALVGRSIHQFCRPEASKVTLVLDSIRESLMSGQTEALCGAIHAMLYTAREEWELVCWRRSMLLLLACISRDLDATDASILTSIEHERLSTTCLLMEKDLRLLFEEAEHIFTRYQRVQENRFASQLHMVSRSLLIPYHPEQLVEIFTQQLPVLGIDLAYVAVRESLTAPLDDVRLITAYDLHAEQPLVQPGAMYRAADLTSGRLLLQDQPRQLLVVPLYTNQQYAGFVIFGFGPRNYQFYTQLASSLGYSLVNNLLFEQVRSQAEELESNVSLRTAELVEANAQLKAEIEERTRIEAALATAHDQAIEASRMKSEFLATMSHEIRTPMNGIAGMTELLLDTELDEEQHSYAKVVYEESYNLLDIINTILDFSKIEAGKVLLEEIPFTPTTELDSVVRLLATKAQHKGINLVSAVAPQVPSELVGDPMRLRQILTNLVGNAVKFTETGEVAVVISCKLECPTGFIAADVEPFVRLQITVRDTGIGMSTETLKRLFTVFTQADSSTTRRYGGTGLGLAITHRLVDLMGGTIEVESEQGMGSKFTVTIPYRCDLELYQKSIQTHVAPSRLHCLVVSNNHKLYNELADYLTTWSIQAEAYADPGGHNIALLRYLYQLVSSGHAAPCVIVDQQDTGIEPLSLLRSIRSDPLLREVYLILVTTKHSPTLQEQYTAAGVDGIMTQPVSQSTLYEVLSHTLLREAPIETESSTDDNPSKADKLVLVVEDYPNNQLLVLAHLKKLGYAAHVVENGQAAVDAVATSRERYQMILMDWQMPVMDGLEATRRIRAIEAQAGDHIPIIGMTANALNGARESCLAAGMDDYISKPIKGDELRGMIHSLATSHT